MTHITIESQAGQHGLTAKSQTFSWTKIFCHISSTGREQPSSYLLIHWLHFPAGHKKWGEPAAHRLQQSLSWSRNKHSVTWKSSVLRDVKSLFFTLGTNRAASHDYLSKKNSVYSLLLTHFTFRHVQKGTGELNKHLAARCCSLCDITKGRFLCVLAHIS